MYCQDTAALSYFPDSAPLLINVVHVLRAAQMSEGLAGDGGESPGGAAAWIDRADQSGAAENKLIDRLRPRAAAGSKCTSAGIVFVVFFFFYMYF